MNNEIRNLSKWLNEEQEAPIDRQALARVLAMAEQEPVAWAIVGDGEWGEYTYGMHFENSAAPNHKYWELRGYELQPLYTSPPARKPLTDEEIFELASEHQDWDRNLIRVRSFARAIEAAHGIKGDA